MKTVFAFYGYLFLATGIATYITDYDHIHKTDTLIPIILIVVGSIFLAIKEEY